MTQNGVYSRADVSLSSPQYKTYTGSRIASKSHLRLSTLLYHHAFKYEISFLSSLSVWAAFMSIFYRARLYVFVSKLCFCGSTLALLFLLLLLLLLLLLPLLLLLLNRIKRRTNCCSGVPNSFIAKVLHRFVKGRTSEFHRTPVEAGVLF